MICKNCGFVTNNELNVCPNCGNQLYDYQLSNNNPINNVLEVNRDIFNNSINNNQINNQNDIETLVNNTNFNSVFNNNEQFNDDIQNEELLYAYIGKNVDKLTNDGFSVNTFLFGFLYILYRKMWFLALVFLSVNLLSILFFNKGVIFFNIITNIILSFVFKNLYIKYVEKKINNIKNKYSDKTNEELMLICRKKGGTNIIPVIIFLSLFYLSIYLIESGNIYNIDNFFNSNNTNNDTIKQTGIIDNLYVEIPDTFILSNSSTDESKRYSVKYEKNLDFCSFTIEKIYAKSYDNSPKKYLDKTRTVILAVSNYDTSGVKKTKINRKSWYYELYTSNEVNQYIYSSVNNDYIYTFQFIVYSDNNKTCYSAYNNMINSLSFK